MSDFDIAYSSLTDCYYVVIGKEKHDITDFVKGKIQQGRADAIESNMDLHNILQDIVYAQGMINRSVYQLNKLLGADKGAEE